MDTRNNKLINCANLSRVLGVKVTEILSFHWVSNKVIQLTYTTKKGKCSTFSSVHVLGQAASDFRKQGAKRVNITVRPISPRSTAWIEGSDGTSYNTVAEGKHRGCTCPDYESGVKLTEKWTCKHQYAVLGLFQPRLLAA